MDSGGSGFLGEPHDRFLDVLALTHHQVGQLVDDDDHIRQPIDRIDSSFVETGQVAGVGPGEPPVAILHLRDGPLERGLGSFRFRDDRHHQVRQAVVRGQLDAFEIHQDEPHLVGLGLAEQARDERVDHDALA